MKAIGKQTFIKEAPIDPPDIPENDSWLSKFCPKTLGDFYGYDNEITELRQWIQSFSDNSETKVTKNAVLITGQPGTGKTALAYALVRDYGFSPMETNSSDIRTSDLIKDKMKHVLGGDSIKIMTMNPQKTAVIMDEIDAGDSKDCPISEIKHYVNYAKHDYEFRWRVHLRLAKKKIPETEIKKKLRDTFFPNKNPIILIANHLTYSIQSLIKDVIHIHLEAPTNDQLFKTMDHIRTEMKMELSDSFLQMVVPVCQADYRRAVTIMESIWSYKKEQEEKSDDAIIDSTIDDKKLVQWLESYTGKDINMPIEDIIPDIFYNKNLTIDTLMKYYSVEKTYLPILIYENYITQLASNTHVSYIDQLDNAIAYYESIVDGFSIRYNSFGKEDAIGDYVGYYNVYQAHMNFHNISNLTRDTASKPLTIEKSKMISKYNHRFCQYRILYHICKKLDISIDEFPIVSYLITKSFFVNTSSKRYYMDWLSKRQLSFANIEKLFKSSLYYIAVVEKYYTKKKQKDLEAEYDKVLADNQIYIDDDDMKHLSSGSNNTNAEDAD
jgi:DNA polymerase III delta prime subunit